MSARFIYFTYFPLSLPLTSILFSDLIIDLIKLLFFLSYFTEASDFSLFLSMIDSYYLIKLLVMLFFLSIIFVTLLEMLIKDLVELLPRLYVSCWDGPSIIDFWLLRD